jgi:hypothetical protein
MSWLAEKKATASAAAAVIKDAGRQQNLRDEEPAAPSAEQCAQNRKAEPIHDRRPEELVGVRRLDEEEETNRRLVDIHGRQPVGERGEREQQRHAAGKAHLKDDQLPRRQIDGKRLAPTLALALRRLVQLRAPIEI